MKKLMAALLAILMLASLAACGQTAAPAETPAPTATPAPTPEPEKVLVDEAGIALTIDDPQWELSKDGTYYQLTGVSYCTNIVVEQYQSMNIFVPAAYIDGGECCGYTAETAPIVIQNNNSGWRSGKAGEVSKSYIENGFVFVNTGSRSRDAGEFGKAPCAVVDLKSAVRTLRLNAAVIPGNMDRIFSVGTSGGGQMSSILGASGNMSEYYSYLYENGAPGVIKDGDEYVSTISDAVYGCMCYCPIADIENADLAYAWMHFDDGVTSVVPMFGAAKEFSPFQLELQNDLAAAYVEYVNSLGLKDADGNELSLTGTREGSMYDAVLVNMSDALNALISASTDADGNFHMTGPSKGMGPNAQPGEEFDSLKAYIASIDPKGEWLSDNGDGTYSVTDMAGFINGTGLVRNKDIPGFDTFDMSAENDAFGHSDETAVHYSASVAAVLEANYDRYAELEGFDKDIIDSYIAEANREDIAQQTYLMNATAILLNVAKGEQEAEPAQVWRTRNGTADEHTSFTIAYDLCMAAKMCGYDVDYSLVWNMTHGSNEGTSTGTFVDWVHSICGGAFVPAEAPAATGDVFTLSENNGMIDIDWTLTLNEDGTYILNEVSAFFDNSYTGTYTRNGDTVVCGPMLDNQPGVITWADPAGFTVTVSGGSFAHADAAPLGGDAPAAGKTASGEFTYDENNGFIDISWTLTLNEDGTYILNETSQFFDNSYKGNYTMENGTVTCGPMGDEQPGQFTWADPAGFAVIVDADTFVPVM